MTDSLRAPVPDLRIVAAESLHAHESHDSQRSRPLIERFRSDEYIINPPVVAPMDERDFVILDGANRCHALSALGFLHLPVQVVDAEGGQVKLDTWNHVISDWTEDALLDALRRLPGLLMSRGDGAAPVATIHLRGGEVLELAAVTGDAGARNALLCQVVATWQRNATLYRSVVNEQAQLREHFPGMVALVRFPNVKLADIVVAARERAWIPPGVSRHIIHGRALRINYPVARFAQNGRSLKQKNEDLQDWLREKLARRELRFYEESTWQFDE